MLIYNIQINNKIVRYALKVTVVGLQVDCKKSIIKIRAFPSSYYKCT